MKTNYLILNLILILSSFVYGQDYQTITSNRIVYFANQFNDIKCIRIDSIKNQTDSIFFPFSNIQQIDYNCYTPYGASWIGQKVILKEDGKNIFFNKFNDSIIVKENALLNESWTMFNLIDSIKVIATIIKHDTMSFISLHDSVKTIGFQVYDKNMNPLNYNINNYKLLLSKNYGFVRIFNFYLFPDNQVDYPYSQFEELNIVGLTNPKIGVQNLSWLDVYDFKIGDELHILDESSSWGGGYDYSTTTKAIYKYLERMDYLDSIVYIYSRRQSIQTTWIDSSSFKFYNDTLKTIIKPDPLFDSKLPEEPIITDYDAYSYYMTNGVNISKTEPSVYEKIWPSHDSCWTNCCADGCFPSYTYIKGLGGPYYQCDNAFSLGGAERKLVYYKKDGITWGSPLIVTGISNIETVNNLKVYPNPADDFIHVSFEDNTYSNYFINIYDIQGKLLKSEKLESNKSMICISDLKSGAYIFRIADNEKVLKISKLIIE